MWTRLYRQSQKVWQYKTKRVGEINTFMGFICCWSGHIIRGNISVYCFDLRDHTFITVLTHTHGSLIWTISTCLCVYWVQSRTLSFSVVCFPCFLLSFSDLSFTSFKCSAVGLNSLATLRTRDLSFPQENLHVFVGFYSGMLYTWLKRC